MIRIANIFGDIVEHVDHHDTIIDFLLEHYPNGFDRPTEIFVNGESVRVENYDMPIRQNDMVWIVHTPGDFITAAFLGKLLVGIFISTALSIIASKIFAPKIPDVASPKERNREKSPTYTINNNQNRFRAGQPIPIIYGHVRTFPSLIAPPYYRYQENEEMLYLCMLVSADSVTPERILLSDTDASNIATNYFQYEILYEEDLKAQGLQNLDHYYQELVRELPDLSNLEFRRDPQVLLETTRLRNNIIRYYPGISGIKPDLSKLQIGGTVILQGTKYDNDGAFTVQAVNHYDDYDEVQVAHTFNPEPVDDPVDVIQFEFEPDDTDEIYFVIKDGTQGEPRLAYVEIIPKSGDAYYKSFVTTNSRIIFSGTDSNDGNVYLVTGESSEMNTIVDVEGTPAPERVLLWDGSYQTIVTYVEEARGMFSKIPTSFGPFIFDNETKFGRKLQEIELDYAAPTGLYNVNDDGDFTPHISSGTATVCYQNRTTGETRCADYPFSISGNSQKAIRISVRFPVDNSIVGFANGDNIVHYVRISKTSSDSTSNRINDKTYIVRLKGLYGFEDTSEWGDVTVMWCKIRASNAISQLSQFQVNGYFVNTITYLDDVIADMYSNEVYGGALNEDDIVDRHLPERVNASFDQTMTIYDAMQAVASSQGYFVYPVGREIRIRKDQPQNIRKYMFNETNIIKGSLKIEYRFKDDEYDSVETSYFETDGWFPKTVRYPSVGLRPEKSELLGVTDYDTAYRMAKLLYNRKFYNRKTATFKTDIQGYVPQYMDRVGVSHNQLKWGVSGIIVTRLRRDPDLSWHEDPAGEYLLLDCDYNFAEKPIESFCQIIECDETMDCDLPVCCEDEDHGASTKDLPINYDYDTIIFVDQKGNPSDPLPFTAVDYRTIHVPGMPTWVQKYPDADNTRFTIGTSERLVQDYIIVAIKPSDKTIEIEAVNYDERVYL